MTTPRKPLKRAAKVPPKPRKPTPVEAAPVDVPAVEVPKARLDRTRRRPLDPLN